MKKAILLLTTLISLVSCEKNIEEISTEQLLIGTWHLSAGKSGVSGEVYGIDGDITWTFNADGSFEGKGSGKIADGINKGYDMTTWNYSSYNVYSAYEQERDYTFNTIIMFGIKGTTKGLTEYVSIYKDSIVHNMPTGGKHYLYRVK